MKTSSTSLLVLAAIGTAGLCSCTTADQASPLQAGVRYEVRTPLPPRETAKLPVKSSTYYFTLDAANPPSPRMASTDTNQHVRTTAYCHDESDHLRYGHLAAAGAPLRFGTICSAAADWSRYPVGTTFRIKSQPGVVYEVDDYGSALVGSGTIDLYRPTMGSMNAWGVRDVDIEIVKWGSFYDSLRIMRGGVHYPHVRRMYQDIQRLLEQAERNESDKQPPVATVKPLITAV